MLAKPEYKATLHATFTRELYCVTVFRHRRLKKVHAQFLWSCRTLEAQRAYWNQLGGIKRWILELITPIPLLSLQEDGRGLLDALDWLESHAKNKPLQEAELRVYHKMACPVAGTVGGKYRTSDVLMKGSRFTPPPFRRVPTLMRDLGLDLAREQESLDKAGQIEAAVLLRLCANTYQRIGLIHPFGDGNGRVARLAMNHLMRRYGMGYVVLPYLAESPELWTALQLAHAGELEPLTIFLKGKIIGV